MSSGTIAAILQAVVGVLTIVDGVREAEPNTMMLGILWFTVAIHSAHISLLSARVRSVCAGDEKKND